MRICEYVPLIELHKTRFAYGESVTFGVGVRASDGNRDAIGDDLWGTSRVTITRPDGSHKTVRAFWPREVWPDGIWRGRSELEEATAPGIYSVIFEFAGRQTAPAKFSVESTDLFDKVSREFVYAASTTPTDLDVTLTVTNGFNRTLRFPYRGINGFVSIFLKSEKVTLGTFYPWGEYPAPPATDLPMLRFNHLTWDVVQKAQIVTLLPGETYRQPLSLQVAVADVRGEKSILKPDFYNVTFGTTLVTLVGERDGDYATMSPVSLPVQTTAHCFIPNP